MLIETCYVCAQVKMNQAAWEQKLKTLFNRFDKGGKGRVTKDDITTQANAFKTIGHLTSEEVDEMQQVFKELWSTFLNGTDSVSLDEWLDGHRVLLNPGKAVETPLEQMLQRAGTLMFRAADKERKGVISADEFAVYLACIGVGDREDAKEIFKKIDVEAKGEIKEDQFLHAFHEFNFQLQDMPSKWLMGPLVS